MSDETLDEPQSINLYTICFTNIKRFHSWLDILDNY